MRSSVGFLGTCLSTALLLVVMQNAVHAIDSEIVSAPTFKVNVETVRESSVESVVIGTGSVTAWRDLPVSAETNAVAIVEVYVDEGDTVKRHQVLARLDDRTLAAQRNQHRAAVSEAEANLATAMSDQARAHAVARGVISPQVIEQRETLVKTAEAKLAFARAVLDETEVKLKQTEILAPADAIVAVRKVTVGQIVQPGTELFRLMQDRRIEVNALVPEADLLKIKPLQAARIFDALGRQSQGTVRILAPIVDERTRLGTVRLALPSETDLKPGMFVRVEIAVDASLSVTVPLKAIVWRDGMPSVFAVSHDGTAVLRVLVIGRRMSASFEVLHGLAAGERIVTDGSGHITDGQKVRFDIATAPALTGRP